MSGANPPTLNLTDVRRNGEMLIGRTFGLRPSLLSNLLLHLLFVGKICGIGQRVVPAQQRSLVVVARTLPGSFLLARDEDLGTTQLAPRPHGEPFLVAGQHVDPTLVQIANAS